MIVKIFLDAGNFYYCSHLFSDATIKKSRDVGVLTTGEFFSLKLPVPKESVNYDHDKQVSYTFVHRGDYDRVKNALNECTNLQQRLLVLKREKKFGEMESLMTELAERNHIWTAVGNSSELMFWIF